MITSATASWPASRLALRFVMNADHGENGGLAIGAGATLVRGNRGGEETKS